jgi:hypothetical protein
MKRPYGGVERYHGSINVAAHRKLRRKTVDAHSRFSTHNFQKPALPGFKGITVGRCIQTAESDQEYDDEHRSSHETISGDASV